ncbi:MAG: protein-methionine-sulfoxide reductase heme-binding subunit MsrQ [Candidatus Acidiferrum sp.]
MRKFLSTKWAKVIVFLLSLAPLAAIAWPFLHHDIIPNPVEFIQHATGDWTLRFLVFTLCITPFRKIFNLPELIRFRRMLGLFAFFYVCLHFSTYIGFDQSFDLSAIWKDVAKRRYITVGFLAFVLLIPLALTSTTGWIRRLGGKRWQALHRFIYISAVAGVIHYYWLVKSAVLRPLTYGAIVAALLAWRLFDWSRRRKKAVPVPARAPQSLAPAMK